MKSRYLLPLLIVGALTALACTDPAPKPGQEETAKADGDPYAPPPDVAAAPDDAEVTPSGLASKVLAKGTGTDKPSAGDKVKVHYSGWTTDGKLFDSSYKRNQPAEFPLNRVIPGWTEGLQLMVIGEKRRFWIPGNLAYGDTPQRPGAPAGTLVFDVELLGIIDADRKIPAPDDVAAPPADAKKTDSGLAYKVLTAGDGDRNPTKDEAVLINYSGWTTDGTMFDSSIVRGQPVMLPVEGIVPGWAEAMQLMKTGDKTLFWIPSELAFGDEPPQQGTPAGMLVFEVELLEIRDKPKPQRKAPHPPMPTNTPR